MTCGKNVPFSLGRGAGSGIHESFFVSFVKHGVLENR
jgi:hypothetical protein